MPVFDLICLAASHKMRGTCFAGLRTDGGGWIRPCADTEHGELYPSHYRLPDGESPRVLDVLRIAFEGPQPVPHQPENWLIADAPWQLIHRGLPDDLAPLLRSSIAAGPALLGDTAGKIEFDVFIDEPAETSLALIRPSDLQWAVLSTPENVRKPRALFQLNGTSYRLPVTDPAYIPAFRNLTPGMHPVETIGIEPGSEVLLSISLSEPFDDGYCYKLVSAIIPVAPATLQEPEAPMGREEATWIIDTLANGVDPYTGEPLAFDGPLANPDTVKALRAASSALRGTGARPARQYLIPENAGKPWDAEEDARLAAAYDAGLRLKALTAAHGRSRGAIKARLFKLGKIEG